MKLGIVGTNFVSDMFMSANSFVGIDVVSVCSGKYENAIKFKEKYNLENAYKTIFEMVESKTIDSIYIATPNSMHYEMAKYALENKLNVYLEKPMAANYEEVKELFEISYKNNVYLHDGIIPLYTKNFEIMKDNLVNIGRIRRAVLSFCKYSSRYDAYLRNENPTTFRNELCNGSSMDLGIYVLSDAIGLFGMPKSFESNVCMLDSGVDGLGSVILRYDDFEVLLLHSKISNSNIMSEIAGEKGIISFDVPSTINNVYLKDKDSNRKISIDQDSGFAYSIREFEYNVLNKNLDSKKASHELSLNIHKLLTDIRKSNNIIYPNDR